MDGRGREDSRRLGRGLVAPGEGSVDELVERGRQAGRAGQFEQALAIFTQVKERAPDQAIGYLGVAQASAFLADFDAAVRNAAEAITHDARHVPAYALLGQLALRLGKPKIALPALERAGLMLSGAAPIFEWLARLYAVTGNETGLRGSIDQLGLIRDQPAAEVVASLVDEPGLDDEALGRLQAVATT